MDREKLHDGGQTPPEIGNNCIRPDYNCTGTYIEFSIDEFMENDYVVCDRCGRIYLRGEFERKEELEDGDNESFTGAIDPYGTIENYRGTIPRDAFPEVELVIPYIDDGFWRKFRVKNGVASLVGEICNETPDEAYSHFQHYLHDPSVRKIWEAMEWLEAETEIFDPTDPDDELDFFDWRECAECGQPRIAFTRDMDPTNLPQECWRCR